MKQANAADNFFMNYTWPPFKNQKTCLITHGQCKK